MIKTIELRIIKSLDGEPLRYEVNICQAYQKFFTQEFKLSEKTKCLKFIQSYTLDKIPRIDWCRNDFYGKEIYVHKPTEAWGNL